MMGSFPLPLPFSLSLPLPLPLPLPFLPSFSLDPAIPPDYVPAVCLCLDETILDLCSPVQGGTVMYEFK